MFSLNISPLVVLSDPIHCSLDISLSLLLLVVTDSFTYFCFIFGQAAKYSKLSFFASSITGMKKLGISESIGVALQFLSIKGLINLRTLCPNLM